MKNLGIYSRKKELFYCYIECNKKMDISLLLKILILLDKYYQGFAISPPFERFKQKWNDFALLINADILYKGNIKWYCDLPVNIQEDGNLTSVLIENACKFSFAKDDNDEFAILIFNLYVDLFTDFVYISTEEGYYQESQRLSAPKNRKTLSDFLKSLEVLVDGNIVEYSSPYHLTSDSVYKYGIVENATHLDPDG